MDRVRDRNGETVTLSGKPKIATSTPEQPPTLLTLVKFGDNSIDWIIIKHRTPGRTFIRYRDDACSGRRDMTVIRTVRDQSHVVASYKGFDIEDENDRD